MADAFKALDATGTGGVDVDLLRRLLEQLPGLGKARAWGAPVPLILCNLTDRLQESG